MQELRITSSCDMTFASTGERVPSAETVFLAIGPDPQHLKPVQLDLAKEWSRELHEFLLPFLDAAHEPGEVLTPGARLPRRERANDPGARQYLRGMRDWCDETEFKPPYHVLEKGGFYYPVRLKDAYAAHLRALAAPEWRDEA